MPERIAPPIQNGSSSIARPIAIQITPIVAPVPKEVPVRIDTIQLRRNAITRNADGDTSFDDQHTITAIVPDARHSAVIKPISPKIISIFRTVLTPDSDIFPSSARLCFRIRPYAQKIR